MALFGIGTPIKTQEVFGVSTKVLEHSYIDRGDLDRRIQVSLGRNRHIALRGESKCGKSWLRQKNIPDGIVVQCRLDKSVSDIYVDALSQIGIKLVIEEGSRNAFKGTMEATAEFGFKLLAKLGFKQAGTGEWEDACKTKPVGHDIGDLRYVSDVIKASGRRLIIEDFHYMKSEQRKAFAFDLKALWDYENFIVIIGIWTETNLLLHLNPDLAGRIEEMTIYWNSADLCAVINKGADVLDVEFEAKLMKSFVEDAFGTVGILQTMLLSTLDNVGITEQQRKRVVVTEHDALVHSGMQYAEQLNALYQTFARRVAGGIRQRAKSTGIYAHMMAVVLAASNDELSRGLPIAEIFKQATAREPRIQKGNLRTILEKIDRMQVDADGRGLVITYDQHQEEVFVVDKQLLLYRKYATVKWPWENIIEQVNEAQGGYEADDVEQDAT